MLPNYGVVQLKLTFDNGSFAFSANPIQASIISLFDQEDKKFTIEEIETKLGFSKQKIERNLKFWLHKGVLKTSEVSSPFLKYTQK